ncbi:MAG: branched-chain amino acid ABC transporter permease [Proteobacteria bacterium]|nr:branched-chain amino acid ABC transporter permease [Pseudomonadota bacterium]
MDYFVNLVTSGLVIGALYGLVAMGFAIVYRATGMVNFAQGEVMMLIAYAAYSLSTIPGLPFWLLLPLVLAASVGLGLVIERLFIRPMLGEPMFSRVMVTIGLAVVIRSSVLLIWGVEPTAFPRPLGSEPLRLAGIALYPGQIFALVSLALLCVLMALFFSRSRIGIAMRATSDNETTALLMGIDVKRISGIAWALSAVFAAFAGLSFCLMFSLEPEISQMGLRGFPATILGGLDSVVGGAFGGLVIGVAENLAGGYLGRGLKEIAGFVLIVVVLMVKPYGLFGQREIERV